MNPRVSGTIMTETKIARAQITPLMRKEPPISKVLSMAGNILMERKRVTALSTAVMEVAGPLTGRGKSSAKRIQGTGPIPAAYPKQMRTQARTGRRPSSSDEREGLETVIVTLLTFTVLT